MIGGTSVKAFPVPPFPSLAEMAEGTLVKLNESGAPVEFYVAKHDYESGLNGAGRTLVVRKDCYDNRAWDAGNINTYASSDLDSWFNSTYKNMLDADIRSLIGTTKIRYTPGGGHDVLDTLERAIFALSSTELGLSDPYANVEGSTLPIASVLRIANQNDGSAVIQWTRSPVMSNPNDVWWVLSTGILNQAIARSYTGWTRPCFTLPSTLTVDENMNIIGGAS